jgi:hypothetical protein
MINQVIAPVEEQEKCKTPLDFTEFDSSFDLKNTGRFLENPKFMINENTEKNQTKECELVENKSTNLKKQTIEFSFRP